MKPIKILATMTLMIFMTACSSTKVTSSWKADDAKVNTAGFNKVIVAALLQDKDRSLQQQMEKELVSDLNAKGIQAVSAYQLYGPKYFSKNEDQALKKLQKSGIDGVLTVVMLDKNKEKDYVPGNVNYRPVTYYNRWYGYYSTVYDRVYSPGYYTQNTNYFWESNLYDLRSDKLLYSAQSESFDPSSTGRLANDYSNKIVSDMTKQGLFAKK
ncbi:MAG: hypothetical protein H0W12_04230 [Chitinophagaceae bacterium]|nr:hypothetical protein [Chitinophagaceae bacterium]